MKKFLLALVPVLMFTAILNAQLSGDKYIPGSGGPNDYATIAAAVADLNLQGVGPGGVTFNVAAGHTETLTARIDLTATGTSDDPIVFQKSGALANPLITAYAGTATPSSAEPDGIWALIGSDYVTIDGIDLLDPNTTNPETMEYGYGLFKSGASDGSQHVTIQNCVISLNRDNNATGSGPMAEGSVGILVINSTPTAAITAITPVSADGTNSYNKFYSNTLENMNYGIALRGFAAATPFTLGDTGNDIGGSSPATGNTIINFGGAAGATNAAAAVRAQHQWDLNVSYNLINNNNGSGVNHPQILRGIFGEAGASANITISHNDITIYGGGNTQAVAMIENSIGTTPAGNTIDISHNTLTGAYLSATSGAFRGIYNLSAAAFINISNNMVTDIEYSNLANTGTGLMYLINSAASNSGTVQVARENIVKNISRFGTTGGTTAGIYFSAGINTMPVDVVKNTVQNLSIDGTGTACTMYGIWTTTSILRIDSNFVDNLNVLKTTGTSLMYGIYNGASPINENWNYNVVSNLAHKGTGIVYGIYAFTATGVRTMSNNLIHTLSTAGTTIAGINNASSSPMVFNNKVYDIESTSSGIATVSGIIQGSLGTAGTATIYNNIIGDLRAPNSEISTITLAPAVRGINITTLTTNSSVNVYYNTVNISASSTGVNFGTAGLYATGNTNATTAALTLVNNIIVNTSTSNGLGQTVAYRRSTGAANTLSNYAEASNYNLFHAGTPGAANLIYFDGVSSAETIDDYKNGVFTAGTIAPRDAASFSENPTFLSTSGSDANFLHINPAVPTGVESGGTIIAGIDDDFGGDIRFGSTGYAGTGTAPDIGADEFEGISLFTCDPPDPGNTLSSSGSLCLGEMIVLSMENPTPGTGVLYQWQSSTNGIVFTDIDGANGPVYSTVPIAPLYYQCEVVCMNDPGSPVASTPVFVGFENSVTSTTPGSRCGVGTVELAAAGTGTEIVWYDVPVGGVSIGTGSPFTTPQIAETTTFYAASSSSAAGSAAVGAGATTSATYSNPFYSLWSNTHTQHVIPAEELIAAGIGAGDLTSVALDVTAPGTLPMIDLSVKIATTNATNASSFLSESFQEVYTNASLLPVVGWNVLTFSAPFNWDGASNIVLDFCHGNGSSSATMSRTVRADATPYVSSIKAHVSAATPAATICADVTTNLLTYSVRPQFMFGGQVACSSPRVPIIATVTPGPDLTLSDDETICNNTILALSVTSNLGDFNIYTWSPVTDLYTDAGATIPYTGTSATTVYFKSETAGTFVYECYAENTGSGCANLAAVEVTNLPADVEIAANKDEHCLSGISIFSAIPSTGYGDATLQWQNSPDGINFTDIADANSAVYTTPELTASTWYKLLVKLGATVCTESNAVLINVYNPEILTTTPGSVCGIGTVVLEATASSGADILWYENPTGGSPVFTGSPFTTPVLTETTTYYVSAAFGGGGDVVVASPTPGTSDFITQTIGWGLLFTINETLSIESVTIKARSTTAGPASMTIQILTPGNTILYTAAPHSFDITTTLQEYIIPVNIELEPGDYKMGMSSTGITNLVRESGGVSFPYSSPGNEVVITAGATGTGTTTTAYYWFYYWKVSGGCESLRVPVVATVTAGPDLILSDDLTICNDAVAMLSVTSDLGDFDSYVWEPFTDLFTNAAATIPYVEGASASTVYFRSTEAGIYTYTCVAEDSGSGCTNLAEAAVTNLPDPVITAQPEVICITGSATLSLDPDEPYGTATFQWQDSPDGIIFTDIMDADEMTFVTPELTVTTYYKVIIKDGSGVTCVAPEYELEVVDPQITSTTPGTRCGIGTVDLEATASAGSVINWYDALTGGNKLGEGSPFTTPQLTETTTFYVSAATGSTGGSGNVGPVDNTIGAGTTSALTHYTIFDVLDASMTLIGFHVYPGAAGDVIMVIQDNSLNVLLTITYPVTSSDVNQKTFIPVNFEIPNGTGYRVGWASGGVSLFRNTAGAVYPYTLDGVVSITGNTFSTVYYYWAYDWVVSTGCETERTAVVATVDPAPALTITAGQAVCPDEIASMTVTSNVGDFDLYVWTPADNLFTDAGCTVPYIDGQSAITVYFKSDAVGTNNYTCTAENLTTECVNMAYSSISVLIAPTPVEITPDRAISDGSIQMLEATGGNIGGEYVLGTDVTVTTVTGVTPYSSFYENVRKQYLVLASELNGLGMFAGNIYSLAFQVTSQGLGTYPQLDFTMKMAHTANTEITGDYGIPTGLWTEVYYSASEPAPPVGWNTHIFDVPFVWDGVSNVLIDICHENDPDNTCSACYSSNSGVAYTATSFNSVFGRYNDNAPACNVSPALAIGVTNYVHRPNMKFEAETPTAITWSPFTNLWLDAGASIPYAGEATTVVYTNTSSPITYEASATGPNGCSSLGFSIFGYRVFGNVYYGNSGTGKPMATDTEVTIVPGYTVNTGTNGYFEFIGIQDGSYQLSGNSTKDFGGLQSLDAILVQRFIANVISFTDLQKRSADVNKSNSVQNVDATFIRRRAGGIWPIPQWTAPDFLFDGPFGPPNPVLDGYPVNVSGGDVNVGPFRTLCSGDVNGSYTPPAK